MDNDQFLSSVKECLLDYSEDLETLQVDLARKLAWTENRVYYIAEYDGHYSVLAVSRNP
jgi:hypothetical protein